MDTKRCPDCDADLPLSEFGKNRTTPDGYVCYCRTHMNIRSASWRKANPEKNRKIQKASRLKTSYGLTGDDYEHLWTEQEGRCAVCGNELKRDISTHVDHDHATGGVRGLLDNHCNLMLGDSKDSADTLVAGADYLRKVTN